jgi:hypothetical protein
VIIVSGFVMWCFNKSLPVLPFAPLRRAEISFVYLLITFRRDHAVFDADHAVPDIQVIVPRRRIQFRKLVDGVEVPSGRLLVLLLATRVAEGRGVLDVMAVSTLPSKMRPK